MHLYYQIYFFLEKKTKISKNANFTLPLTLIFTDKETLLLYVQYSALCLLITLTFHAAWLLPRHLRPLRRVPQEWDGQRPRGLEPLQHALPRDRRRHGGDHICVVSAIYVTECTYVDL